MLSASGSPEAIPIARWLVLQRVCQNRKIATEAVVKNQQVFINGTLCTSLAVLVKENDEVEFQKRSVKRRKLEYSYYILHKPPGCLSSHKNMKQLKGGGRQEDDRPNVYDFIPEPDRAHVNSIGRLDFDTTGLLLFTSDGLLHNTLASPTYKVKKIYRCTLRTPEPLSEDAIQQLRQGVQLPHAKGAIVTGEASNVTNDGVVDLCILGGYKHQVKLMLAIVKRPLRLLHRRSFADLELPEDLAEGKCRKMTANEIEHLYNLANRQIKRKENGVREDEVNSTNMSEEDKKNDFRPQEANPSGEGGVTQ